MKNALPSTSGVTFLQAEVSKCALEVAWRTYPENEPDDGRARRGHDFGAVGHEVEQRGHDALRCVIKLVAQQRRQMSAAQQSES